ncbi:MAG: UDP-N-acetylglucosamine 1-carboxyvinyltransferase [Acidobacteriota bacterium]
MDKFHIVGPSRLAGRVRASGAKNAALPALAATLLADGEPLTLRNVPGVRDIRTMMRLLDHLGVSSEDAGDTGEGLVFRRDRPTADHDAPYEVVKTMRASVLVLGPLLARFGHARVSLPGGCAIGVRPIDQHLKGLEALGASVELSHGYVEASADQLRGTRFRFDMPTVTGTENILMAASLAKGTTVLENCAREPEIVDLANLLNTMGARISGAGEATIVIDGVDSLGGGEHTIIPDRIEGGTYLIGAALTRGDVTLEGSSPADLAPLLDKLAEAGANVEISGTGIRVRAADGLQGCDLETQPHPGFPTDLQAQWMTLMTSADGVSTIRETIFENRFQHAPELMRMGADIRMDGGSARVYGARRLTGAGVMATDLRASACLVLAGVAADGETVVDRIYHLERGYEGMELKLQSLGARVARWVV